MSNETLKNNRRDFIKKGVAGLAGATLLPSLLTADEKAAPPKNTPKKKLPQRPLGKTGLKIPIISNGAAYNPDLVKTALDSGIINIFTSPVYKKGKDEETIGAALKGRPRDSFQITTSIYCPYLVDVKTKKFRSTCTKQYLLDTFSGSLKRLGVDYVDVFYLAGIERVSNMQYEPFVEAMKQLQKEGKIKHLGIATHKNEPEIIRAVGENKLYDVVMTAYNFRQPHLGEMNKAIDYAAGKGTGIIAFKTQAGGFWDKERTQRINNKAAIKWALQNKNVHSVLAGFSNFKEMETAISVMDDLPLTPKEKSDLKLGDKLAMNGLYCQQCGECTIQCPKGLDVPTLMRGYMYAYGYQRPGFAKETIQSVTPGGIPCGECGTCAVQCKMGFNVREKVMDIARLKEVPEEFLV